MSKELLHLYLGCQAEIDNGNRKTTIAITPATLPMANVWVVKPHLRTLESLTAREYFELYKVQFGEDGTSGSFQIKITTELIAAKTFTPLQFTYLLSLGIDLFGLIEKGEAILKTKNELPEPPKTDRITQ